MFQPEALRAIQEVTNGLKHSEKRFLFFGNQRVTRAVTRVNVEQASKCKSWELTRQYNGVKPQPVAKRASRAATGPIGVVTTARVTRVKPEQEKSTRVRWWLAAGTCKRTAREGSGRPE
jgi:hypothetical protein